MKKSWVVKALSILLAGVLVFLLSGCYLQDKKEDDYILSEKMERKIKEAYLAYHEKHSGHKIDKTADDTVIKHYLGNYNGSLAVIIEGDANPTTISAGFELGGIIFHLRTQTIRIYKSGRIYLLQEAYLHDFLTKTDLERLSERYYALYPHLHPDVYIDT